MKYSLLLMLLIANFTIAQPNPKLAEALNLVHVFSGAGNELDRAAKIAVQLAKTYPKSGMSETIRAELLATEDLQSDDISKQIYNRVIALTNQAIAFDKTLASAYVVRARALLKAKKLEDANADIALALQYEPQNASAYFLLADIKRRGGDFAKAVDGYQKFIDLTPDSARKSNGHYWLYETYMNWSYKEPTRRQELIDKAGESSKASVDLDPKSAWKNVNYAVFLNGRTDRFVEAQRYAENALKAMDFPMGRMHLAAAMYQQLGQKTATLSKKNIAEQQKMIAMRTGLTLEQAIDEFDPKTNTGWRLSKVKTALDQP